MPHVNALTAALADACAALPLDAKIVVAPSDRVGRQWLDLAASAGSVVANARPTVMARLMRDMAAEGLERAGLAHPREIDRLAILHDLLASGRGRADAYFSELTPSLALLRLLDNSFAELDGAGVTDPEALAAALSPPGKGREIARLHALFTERLASAGLARPAEVAAMAAKAAGQSAARARLFIPRDLFEGLSGLEKAFLEAWPDGHRRILPVDAATTADIAFFHADSRPNEAREIFRRLAAEGTPLDNAEVAAVGPEDAAALADAALECFGGPGGAAGIEDLPLTFADGLPPGRSRPERLLAAWLEWVDSGRTADGLAALCGSGLLDRKRLAGLGTSPERLAAFFLALPPGADAGEATRAAEPRSGSEGGTLRAARELTAALAPPPSGERSGEILAGARELLSDWAESRGELDAYARARLLEDPFLSGGADPWSGFDAKEWLESLAGGMKLMGKGPQPGKLHISGLGGGHAGRDVLFVMGLDGDAFPGGDRQDPVFLDRERRRLSGEMRLAADRRAGRERELSLLLARARGRAVLSHSRRDAGSGQELFPADALAAMLAAGGDGDAFSGRPAASLAPDRNDKLLTARDYWLARQLAGPPLPPGTLADFFPGLAAGERARSRRASAEPSEYDGCVPEAGRDYAAARPALSATQIETLAACPMQYFFRHVLGLEPPERYGPEKGGWLSGRDRGSLLHQVFKAFLAELIRLGERADAGRHKALLERVAEPILADWRRRRPPSDRPSYERELRHIRESCAIFLHEEALLQRTARPLYLEASFGAGADGALPWSGGGAFALVLPSGRELPLSGTLDRVDRFDAGGLAIWDYKTGGADGFEGGPFSGGDKLQAALYAAALAAMPGNTEPVAVSGYFFPSPREGGRRIAHEYRELRDVLGILDGLVRLLEAGSFPFRPVKTFNPREYAPLYRAVGGERKLRGEAEGKA